MKGALYFPFELARDLKDFIESLLLEQKERLNYEDCIRHPFFNPLIWDGLRNGKNLTIILID
jgi:hypothetical protein